MNRNKIIKYFFCLICILSFSFSQIYAQSAAVDKSVELLNRSLILNDYEKAYSYAKFIIKYYAGEDFPDEVLTSVQSAVSGYSNYLETNEQWDQLLNLENQLKTAPANIKISAQSHIQHAHDYFTKLEQEKIRQEEEEQRLIQELKRQEQENAIKEQEKAIKEEQKAEKEAETKKILDLIEAQRKSDIERDRLRMEQDTERDRIRMQKDNETEQKRQESESAYREQLNSLMAEMNKNNTEAMRNVSDNNKYIMFGFLVFIFIFIIVVVFLVILSFKQNKNNQEQMKNTILTMQAMRSAQPVIDVLPLPLQLENRTLELAGSGGTNSPLMIENHAPINENTSSIDNSSSGTNNMNAPDQMKNLLLACKQYGEQIDKATGRKNVTSTVAELVYKISQHLGYPETEAIMYYAAALVYDIGFLNIEPSILKSDTLSQEQFELLKTHTSIGQNMVFFVDEKNRQLFKDAAGKHHENLDGSGYPQGLKGDQIPYIARAIRAAESYVALISQRQYKEIHDRNYAINELKNAAKQYDQNIIEAIDAIV